MGLDRVKDDFHYRHKRAWLRSNTYLLTRALPGRVRRIRQLSREPIVIGGCGRSGTTLLLSVLSCHPEIHAIPQETGALCRGALKPELGLDAPFRLELLYEHLVESAISPTARRWCEKTPRNVWYFERLIDHFGAGIRLLNIVRDGRDVVRSRHPSNPDSTHVQPRRWVADVGAGKAVEDHPQVLTIRYEDLVGQYEPTLRRVCEFLEVDFVTAFLAYPTSAVVKSNTAWFGPARAVTTNSVGAWRESSSEDPVRELLAIPEALELLRHYSYETA
ncbi:MAG: sulfotransferase [Acidimicrobiales bacterium]